MIANREGKEWENLARPRYDPRRREFFPVWIENDTG
jgi:tryptophan-rich sensory protein